MFSLTTASKKAFRYLGSKLPGSSTGEKHRVKEVAQQMPLIHVTAKESTERFQNLLLTPPHKFSVSLGCPACTHKTCEAERKLDLGRNFYLAAGRAFKEYGSVALVFDQQHEALHSGNASFFDSGLLAHGELKTDFDPPNVKKLRNFTKKHSLPLSTWRAGLSKHLDENFSKPSDYFDGEPYTSGPAEMFSRNKGNYYAWIFEVRFQEGPSVYDASIWNGPSDLMQNLDRVLDDFPLFDSHVITRLQEFIGRAIIREGFAQSAELVERRVREDLHL